MNVGQGLPSAQRRAWAQQQVAPGRILYLCYPLTNETKDKYVVIADDDDWPRVLAVNSVVPPFLVRNADMAARQVVLSVADYGFLHHDSHLNCTEVLQKLTRDQIVDQLVVDVRRGVGELTDATRTELMAAVCGAKTVPTADQNAILTALRQ